MQRWKLIGNYIKGGTFIKFSKKQSKGFMRNYIKDKFNKKIFQQTMKMKKMYPKL